MIGVDHIGILVGTGEFPRELSVERTAEVSAEVLPPQKVSALFLTADLLAISKVAEEQPPSNSSPA
jgi:phosphoribosylanthranilate isomerase